jgi:hypothetical protein
MECGWEGRQEVNKDVSQSSKKEIRFFSFN